MTNASILRVMWFKRHPPSMLRGTLATSKLTPQSLQGRYLRQWAWSWLWLNGLLCLPIIYLVQQNYTIFLHLAHLQAPYLIEHIEREQVWFFGIMLSTLTASFIWGFWLAYRWSHKLLSPLKRIQDHLYHLSRGRWSIPELILDEPELRSLTESYNYFYRSLQVITRQQLDLLNLIKPDRHDFDSAHALDTLKDQKLQRLGLDPQSAALGSRKPDFASAKPSTAQDQNASALTNFDSGRGGSRPTPPPPPNAGGPSEPGTRSRVGRRAS
jgi:hypothetical protein